MVADMTGSRPLDSIDIYPSIAGDPDRQISTLPSVFAATRAFSAFPRLPGGGFSREWLNLGRIRILMTGERPAGMRGDMIRRFFRQA